MNCNYKVKITDIQTKYKFKVFCTGYDDSEIKEKIDAMYQAWPKASAEGETPTLDNTANATMSIDLKGNTSQNSTSGKNLLPNNVTTQTKSGITFTKNLDGSITINGTATSNVDLYFVGTESQYIDFGLTTATYNLNGCIGGSENTYMLFAVMNRNGSIYYYSSITASGRNIIVETGDTFRIFIRVISGQTLNNLKIYPQLEKGSTATDYEPYTNGASPNPDYPQDVEVVTGDNTINICGKNLIGLGTQLNGYVDASNLGFVINGSAVGYYFETSKLPNTITFSSINGNRANVCYFDEIPALSVVAKLRSASNDNPRTITVNKTYPYVHIQFSYNYQNVTNIQIESGSSATTYEPYQSQSYAVNLGTMELCKIGNYQDYFYKDSDKWYLHKEIGKVVLNGSESGWHTSSLSVAGYKSYYVDSSVRINQDALGSKCNYFEYKTYNEWQNLLKATFIENTYQAIGIRVIETFAPTLEDFKTWLSTHNTIAYFVLATPTTTEITDSTLISQLEATKEAESYSGQTNISQTNDDKPFILTAKALKDLSNL